MFRTVVQDLRFAIRCLLRNRGFTAAAIAALALGLGANTAIFSVVNAVLLRPLPYPDSSRLVVIWGTQRNLEPSPWLLDRDFARLAERNRTLDPLAGWLPHRLNVTVAGEPQRLESDAVTPAFFRLFGARTILGRGFLPQEERPGDDRVIVLSSAFWQHAFASDRGVIGRMLQVDGVPHQIIGVLEPGFHPILPRFETNPDCYVTMSHTLQGDRYKFTMFPAGGRLRPGVTLAQAQADMSTIADALEKETPRFDKGKGVQLKPFAEEVSQDALPAMVVLLGAVGCVLLICCANVANLSLARATARQKELLMRAMLGASRGRLVRQLLTESMLLAVVGGIAGMLLARWCLALLVAAMPIGMLPRTGDMAVDFRAFAFAFALALLTGLLFGILPALNATRARSIKEARTLRGALVVAEVALALVLLTGAGLLIRTFLSLRNVDLGFHADRVVTAGLALPKAKYPGMPQRAAFIEEALRRVQSIPGVEAAAVTNSVPVSNAVEVSIGGLEIEGVNRDAASDYRTVTPDYFRIMGIPLKRGRLLADSDRGGTAVIVNEAFVRRYWPHEPPNSPEPLGRRMKWDQVSATIVGVVGDVKFRVAKSEASAEIFVPYTLNLFEDLALVVRTNVPLSRIAPALRASILEVDRDQPLERIATMDVILDEDLATPRFHMLLIGAFAALALVLAGVGIYSVTAYSVAQRTREIGIRMAIGATGSNVLGSVLWQAGLQAFAGVVAGIVGALGATRVLAGFLFGVKPVDPLTFGAVAALLIAVALVAAAVPAHRAIQVDPMVVLRWE